uniref:Uncharacterized protein n=1 Tax=Arundo donax TaxID=35708 RepID=A0A0A9FXE2_ARUDO
MNDQLHESPRAKASMYVSCHKNLSDILFQTVDH